MDSKATDPGPLFLIVVLWCDAGVNKERFNNWYNQQEMLVLARLN